MSKQPVGPDFGNVTSRSSSTARSAKKDEAIIQGWIEDGYTPEQIGPKWQEFQRLRREKANAPPAPPAPATTIADTVGGWLKTGAGAVADFGKSIGVGVRESLEGPADQRIKDMEGDLARQHAHPPEGSFADIKSRSLRRDIPSLKSSQEAHKGRGTAGQVGALAGNLGMSLFSPGAMGANIAGKGAKPLVRAITEGSGALLDVGIGAAQSGKTPQEVRDEGLLALLLAAPAGAAAAKLGNRLRDTRGQTGKHIQALAEGKDFLASPEAKKLDWGISGIGQVAEDEGRKLGQVTAGRLQSSLDTLKANESAIPRLREEVDVSAVPDALDDSVTRFNNGNPHRPDVLREVEGIKKNLRREVSTPIRRTEDVAGDFTGYVADGPAAVYPYATPADLLAQRRLARQQADFGTPQTPENAPFRELYGTLSEATHSPDLPDNIGGKFKAMDEQFSSDMEKLEKANELVIGRADPRAITDSVRAGEAAASRLSQALMDTKAGGVKSRLLEDIKALGPEYADAVQRVSAKIAWNATRFGPPRVFSHSGKWYLQPFIQNMDALLAQVVEPATRMTGLQAGLAGKMSPLIRDPLEAWINGRKLQTEEEDQ